MWTEDGCYLVETSNELLFRIGFMDDYSIWTKGAYQFYINNESRRPSPNDEKLKATIFRIIEVFFAANPDILLYILHTHTAYIPATASAALTRGGRTLAAVSNCEETTCHAHVRRHQRKV